MSPAGLRAAALSTLDSKIIGINQIARHRWTVQIWFLAPAKLQELQQAPVIRLKLKQRTCKQICTLRCHFTKHPNISPASLLTPWSFALATAFSGSAMPPDLIASRSAASACKALPCPTGSLAAIWRSRNFSESKVQRKGTCLGLTPGL